MIILNVDVTCDPSGWNAIWLLLFTGVSVYLYLFVFMPWIPELIHWVVLYKVSASAKLRVVVELSVRYLDAFPGCAVILTVSKEESFNAACKFVHTPWHLADTFSTRLTISSLATSWNVISVNNCDHFVMCLVCLRQLSCFLSLCHCYRKSQRHRGSVTNRRLRWTPRNRIPGVAVLCWASEVGDEW